MLGAAILGATAPRKPIKFKVKGQEWSIIYFRPTPMMQAMGAGFVGVTECHERFIGVLDTQEPKEMADTILHEAAHAYVCDSEGKLHNDSYNSPPEGDHPGIEVIAEQELQLIQENPELMRWIERQR